jgi:hypothetical protein
MEFHFVSLDYIQPARRFHHRVQPRVFVHGRRTNGANQGKDCFGVLRFSGRELGSVGELRDVQLWVVRIQVGGKDLQQLL